MERVENYKGKKGLILKTLERCRSLGHRNSHPTSMPKSKSWKRSRSTVKHRIAPGGYFSVHVGSNKERFVIKVECMNHPLFKNLLDEAEMEYGFKSEGPLELPCDVDLFYEVLCKIDQEMMMASPKCGFAKSSNVLGKEPATILGRALPGPTQSYPPKITLIILTDIVDTT